MHFLKRYAIIIGRQEVDAQISGCSADGSVLEWGSRGRWFKSSHSDHIEWGPFFEHFYRKTDLSFFESLATAGLFLFVFFQYSHEKVKNTKELFLRRVGIWTLLFRKILIFECLRCLIFQRSVRSGFIIKRNVLFHASLEALLRGVLSAVRLFFFEGRKECFSHCVIVWLASCWEGLFCTAFLQQLHKCSGGVLLTPVTVKGQAFRFTTLPICVSECSGHKIGAGIARHTPTDDFAWE